MRRYVLTRLATSIGLLFLSSVVIFCLMRVIPGDPTITKLGGSIQGVDPRALVAIRHQLGLDRGVERGPLAQQRLGGVEAQRDDVHEGRASLAAPVRASRFPRRAALG